MASAAESRKIQAIEPPPASVRTVVLKEEVVAAGVRYSALVKELQKVEMSFRVSGTVEFLHQVEGPGGLKHNIFEGDTLKKGEVIARLDPSDYRRECGVATARLATAEAKLAQSISDAELAQNDFTRNQSLATRGAISVADFDAFRAKLRSTSALELANRREVESARIELEKAEANLSYCTLAVPFEEGTVAARYIENNERVSAMQKAFLLVDLSSVVIAFNVPDSLVGRLTIGQSVEVGCEALPTERFVGVIHKISSTAESTSRTYPIEVRVDHPRGLKPGMVANVNFRREERAYLLPLTAFGPGESASRSCSVYKVAERNGKTIVKRLPIEFDAVLDNRMAVRMGGVDGLSPGDRVVATGIHRLRDGESVQVVD